MQQYHLEQLRHPCQAKKATWQTPRIQGLEVGRLYLQAKSDLSDLGHLQRHHRAYTPPKKLRQGEHCHIPQKALVQLVCYQSGGHPVMGADRQSVLPSLLLVLQPLDLEPDGPGAAKTPAKHGEDG